MTIKATSHPSAEFHCQLNYTQETRPTSSFEKLLPEPVPSSARAHPTVIVGGQSESRGQREAAASGAEKGSQEAVFLKKP